MLKAVSNKVRGEVIMKYGYLIFFLSALAIYSSFGKEESHLLSESLKKKTQSENSQSSKKKIKRKVSSSQKKRSRSVRQNEQSALASAESSETNRTPQGLKSQVSSKGGKKSSVRAAQNSKKSQRKIRRPSSRKIAGEPIYLDEVLGPDYYEPFSSAIVKENIDPLLQAIDNLCGQKDLTLEQKVKALNKNLKALRQAVDRYLKEPNLSIPDELLLRGIESNTDPSRISYAKPITKQMVQEINLRGSFITAYFVDYGLPDNTEVKDFPHEWAKQIFNGIHCLYTK